MIFVGVHPTINVTSATVTGVKFEPYMEPVSCLRYHSLANSEDPDKIMQHFIWVFNVYILNELKNIQRQN